MVAPAKRTIEDLLRKQIETNPHIFFTHKELAEKFGCDQSSISKAIETLKKEGLIREKVVIDGKARTSYIGKAYPERKLQMLAMRYLLRPNLYEYVFGFDLKNVTRIARIARIGYDHDSVLSGFQREQQKAWIKELTGKLNSPTASVTDPVTVFMEKDIVTWTPVKFPAKIEKGINQPEFGIITLPYSENFHDDEKPAILIDGQQRSLAAGKTDRESIPILVTGYIEDLSDNQFLTDEFIKNNSHKNLPKDLLDLLATISSPQVLPGKIEKRVEADLLTEILNRDETSPFHNLIKSPANPEGYIAMRSVIDMIQTSQRSGHLQGILKTEEQKIVLINYWTAVSRVFDRAWSLPPNESKLTHGVGIAAMGALMDVILPRIGKRIWAANAVDLIVTELQLIANKCIWTEPEVPEGSEVTAEQADRIDEWESDWKHLQNMSGSKATLTRTIKSLYNEALMAEE